MTSGQEMIIVRGSEISGASFSPCLRYRYSLWRQWNFKVDNVSTIAFIGLNPSTASEWANDPTVTRCIHYAQRWGFDRMYMLNLFAWRDTDPSEMKAAKEPVGVKNNHTLVNTEASMLLCCWGTHGKHRHRQNRVLTMLRGRKLHALELNKDGSPRHPLYLAKSLVPRLWYPKDSLLGGNLF